MTDAPEPWSAGSGSAVQGKRFAPAVMRNKDAILAILREELPSAGTILEIASGSGEHMVHFAKAMPHLQFIPSDKDAVALISIDAWRQEAALPNILSPHGIDAADADWIVSKIDALLCINMVHISEWDATVGLFKGSATALEFGSPLILYGPYLEDNVETAPSNVAFDLSLKLRNSAWGLRNVADVDRIATQSGFMRTRRVEMPANNLMLVYRRG